MLLGVLLAEHTSMFFTCTKLKVLNGCDVLVEAEGLASTPGHLGSAGK